MLLDWHQTMQGKIIGSALRDEADTDDCKPVKKELVFAAFWKAYRLLVKVTSVPEDIPVVERKLYKFGKAFDNEKLLVEFECFLAFAVQKDELRHETAKEIQRETQKHANEERKMQKTLGGGARPVTPVDGGGAAATTTQAKGAGKSGADETANRAKKHAEGKLTCELWLAGKCDACDPATGTCDKGKHAINIDNPRTVKPLK